MRKYDLKLVAKLWVASLANTSEGGFDADEVGLTEEELGIVTKYAHEVGDKLAGKHGHFTDLKKIVEYVYDTYYE